MSPRFILGSGILFMILAVAFGAFGAHALKSILGEQQLQIWKTATDYQFYHALGMIALGTWSERSGISGLIKTAGLLLTLGIILFSGSLYLLALTGITKLGMLTPVGGLAFIAGWIFWLISVLLRKN